MRKRKPKEYEVTCTYCKGTGEAFYSRCHRCDGSGVVTWIDDMMGRNVPIFECDVCENIFKDYFRLNTEYLQGFFDDFTSSAKTYKKYKKLVSRNSLTVPFNCKWQSVRWEACMPMQDCKLIWKATKDFDHDILVTADNGKHWTSISKRGKMNYSDRVIALGKPGNKIGLEVSGGTKGSLLHYVILLK